MGIVGVAPGARIWAIKVCDIHGECKITDQMKGIEYAIKHANEIDVLNISIENPNSPALNSIINAAVKAGITVVAAAGNSGKDASTTSPANNPNVLTALLLQILMENVEHWVVQRPLKTRPYLMIHLFTLATLDPK